MALIDDVKLSIPIKSNAFNMDIEDLIEACKLDLGIAGIKVINEEDKLTKQAIKLYCKANFGSNENAERFAKAYEYLKSSMSLCGDYNTEAV